MGRSEFIIPIEAIQDYDTAAVGGKALGLARMIHIRLGVPDGFCVSSAAYREHLNGGNTASQIKAFLAGLANAAPERKREVLAGIRRSITELSLSETLIEQIKSHYEKLGAGRVAVRSSATAEDMPEHSFAGQYDTYLGVAGLEDCIDAIKKCWGSVWTERAYEYRQKNGFDHITVNMAVIVQTFIEADVSGVIFTSDPVTGSSSRIIVEACSGLGDSLVSGKVTPDRFIIRKRNLKIISRRIQNRKIEFVFDKTDSIKKNADENNKMRGPCIGNRTAKKLAKLARRAEEKFGCPQDIEWSACGNKIWFLQGRPITAVPQKKSWEDRQVWTNANTGEVLPDVATPITWSLIQMLLNEIFDRTLGLVAISRGQNPIFERVAGRLHFNINTLVAIFRVSCALEHLDLNKFFGGEQERMYSLGQLDIPDEDIPKIQFSPVRFIFKVPGLAFRIFTYTPKRGERMVAELKWKIDQLPDIDIVAINEEKLAKHLLKEVTDVRNTFVDARYGAIYSVIGLIALPILHTVCRKWLGDTNGAVANSLLIGAGNMDSAQAALDLWTLAVKAHKTAQVEEIILSGDNWKATRKKIDEVPQGEQFLKTWDEFMIRHGQHCRGEMELFNQRWSESPDYILEIVRSYMRSIEQTDPLENYNRYTQQREDLTKSCRKRLRNPIKRAIFNCILSHAQRFSAIRENTKSIFVRLIQRWREMLIELGKRLNSKGILGSPDDIFFLKLEEIEPVTQNKADFDIKKTIASRRAEYEKKKSVMPPKVVIGKFDPDNFVPDTVDTNVEVLKGLGVSSGVVRGKARVILRADTDEQVLAGEILVAPFTDPGWTPYFVPAAAIVMDQGGLLSHGSIIAREYGIAAVVNVGPASQIIKTGQTIEVDANRGVVKILQ